MTKDGVLGLLCLVLLVAMVVTDFKNSTINWLTGMVFLTAIYRGD
jgi:hypothetical protein